MDLKEKKNLSERIEAATRKMFKEWEFLDEIQKPSQDSIEIINKVEETMKKEINGNEDKIKVIEFFKNVTRKRSDIGEITFGEIVIKKIKIIEEYKGQTNPSKSIAYYQLIPEVANNQPIAQILRWAVIPHPCWVIWFTSPIARGMKTRTSGEYLVVYSLDEKESEDYDLLQKFNQFPCFEEEEGSKV